MELACIRFRFLETIERNALKDGRNGSTLYFADEPIGNQRSILRSALYILEERISFSRRFMADDLGPCAFEPIQKNNPEFEQIDRSSPMSERTRRMVNSYNTTTENQANIVLLMYNE